MKTGVYIPNDVLEAAGKKYHAVTGAEYTISELVQVGLRVLAGSSDRTIRANRPTLATGNAPEVPGLKVKAKGDRSDE